MTDPGELRASDAEREAVVEQLRIASVEGRLTLVELTDRTEAAYTATTHAELALLTQDLPAAGVAAPAPAPATEGRKRRWFVGVMGDSKRRGKWRIDQELGAVAVMGDVVLDLREAEVRTNSVDILAVSVMGDVKIIVPDGVYVDLDGVAVMGDKKVKVDQAAPGKNVPVVRVKAYAVMGDVKVVGDSHAQPLQRGFAAWREHWRQLHGDDWREIGRQLREEGRELRRQLRDDRMYRGY
ncbi:DUF1707 domain-containing protein [Nonomuraea sp. NPDC050404]|uniref:DUF1707 SHOCT-like domain-containing protein n=1 Tax=Nonomuraea sp. NPDC050404 TaxID=3155783 RepID=UPI0033CEA1C1